MSETAETIFEDILDFHLETSDEPVAHSSKCLEIIENLNFCLGNAVQLVWSASSTADGIADLEKACAFIKREIARRRAAAISAKGEKR